MSRHIAPEKRASAPARALLEEKGERPTEGLWRIAPLEEGPPVPPGEFYPSGKSAPERRGRDPPRK